MSSHRRTTDVMSLTHRAAQSAKQIKEWLSICSQNHVKCKYSASPKLPKRLIYLDEESNTSRLIGLDEPKEVPEYVALSYCWGGTKDNFKTVSANLHDMEQSIPLDKLPKTLKDVLKVMENLGLRYLWVDALCIVQDNGEWNREVEKMGDIYSNAFLVISAMASQGVHGGLFTTLKDYSAANKYSFHAVMNSCRSMPQEYWKGPINHSFPLLCRGWAFQERLLARRIVHITDFELVWECKEDRWCQCKDQGLTKNLSGKINNMNAAFKSCLEGPVPAKVRSMWRECVKSYSKRNLTKPEDRLVAISGVAQRLRGSSVYLCLYLKGLWKDALPWDLLWYCDQTSPLSAEKPRGPSWSWASVNCGIEWPTSSQVVHEPLEHILKSAYFEHEIEGVQNIGGEKTTKGSYCDYKLVSESEIALIARTVSVFIKSNSDREKYQQALQTTLFIEEKDAKDAKTLPFYPDIRLSNEVISKETKQGLPLSRGSAQMYYYVEIVRHENDSGVWEAGLVVRRSESSENRYERVGVGGDVFCSFQEDRRDWLVSDAKREIILR